jgi:SAM-dependent methyltransferase
VDKVLSIFLKNPWVAVQRFHTQFHWQPREDELLKTLEYLSTILPLPDKVRVIDIGCGDGLLAPAISRRGVLYFGIDAHDGFIDLCKEKYKDLPNVTFKAVPAESLANEIKQGDIAVINGVMHHLSSEQITMMLNALRDCAAVIILDHDGQPLRWSYPFFFQYLIQFLDKGRFVRRRDYFKRLPGWQVAQETYFTIPLAGFPLWPYLCYLYIPLNKKA